MSEPDIDRILNFLIGNEPIKEFESWVYNDVELEERIGEQFYYELIEVNYNDKSILFNLNKAIIGKFVSDNDFEDFKYKDRLLSVGWYPDRKIEVKLTKSQNRPEIQNALKIIEEFGGLKFISPFKRKDWVLTLVEI